MGTQPEYSLTFRHETDERNYPITIVAIKRYSQVLAGRTFDGHLDDRELGRLLAELARMEAGRLPF